MKIQSVKGKANPNNEKPMIKSLVPVLLFGTAIVVTVGLIGRWQSEKER